jgi:hypothetical protein
MKEQAEAEVHLYEFHLNTRWKAVVDFNALPRYPLMDSIHDLDVLLENYSASHYTD